MNRGRALAAVLLAIGAVVPTVAPAQNLEAGKSPGQLFSNTCTACHRSPRGLLRTVPPGSLPGFLREHYTTSRDMAQQLSGFLISNGATDTRGRPQEVRQQPAGAEPPRQPRPGEAEVRPQPSQQAPQQQQQPQQQQPQAAEADPNDARLSRRERRAKREAERQKRAQEASQSAPVAERNAERRQKNRRITPARIEAATARGKEALPLGSVIPGEAPVATPEPAATPVPEAVSPASAAPEPALRADPVPQVTPAPVSPTAEAPPDPPMPEQLGAPENLSSGSIVQEDAPSAPTQGPPPKPPISN